MQKSERGVRIVVDTNIVVSGLIWHGAPRRVLDTARAGTITLFTSTELLAELEDVLRRPKFALLIARVPTTSDELIASYRALATVVIAPPLPVAVADDPDDDAVLACAVAAQAQAIVSGDDDLLRLDTYQGIAILTAPTLLARVTPPAPTPP